MEGENAERIKEVFPMVARIESEELRTSVIEAWALTLEETNISIEEFPWSLKVQSELGLEDLYLKDHIIDVTAVSARNAEYIQEEMDIAVDSDIVIAGALVHDISKPYEFTSDRFECVDELLGHPYFGVYVSQRVGLPIEVAHIILSHTSQTTVEPKTIEARIVSKSDEIAADALRTLG